MMRGEQGGPGYSGKRIIRTVPANLTAGKSNRVETPPLNSLMTNLERNAAFYSHQRNKAFMGVHIISVENK